VKWYVINRPEVRRGTPTYINVRFSSFSVIDRVFGVLLRDALLPLVEAFAGLFGPPFLELAVLIVHPTRRVEGVL